MQLGASPDECFLFKGAKKPADIHIIYQAWDEMKRAYREMGFWISDTNIIRGLGGGADMNSL